MLHYKTESLERFVFFFFLNFVTEFEVGVGCVLRNPAIKTRVHLRAQVILPVTHLTYINMMELRFNVFKVENSSSSTTVVHLFS